MRRSLLFFFLGVVATALCAAFALHERDVHWQLEAYNHSAGGWKFNARRPGHVEWIWLDDYVRQELAKKAHPTPMAEPQPAVRL